MTRTSPSIAAGAEHRAALASWLRRAARAAPARAWVLRGSLVLEALCEDARPAADIDYVLPGDAESFAPDDVRAAVAEIARLDDPSPPAGVAAVTLELVDAEVIFAETRSPGLRARLRATATSGGAADRAAPAADAADDADDAAADADDDVSAAAAAAATARPRAGDRRQGVEVQLDLAVGDPMVVPPRELRVAGGALARCCAPETLFAWKVHGLCEYGRGTWRAKDLFDADLLWRRGALDEAGARAALELAFSSRGTELAALDDLRHRASWGTSRGGRRKWRALARRHPPTGDFAETCARLRGALDELLAL
ncbi:MAG: nucleotidyl transferase AbiEii/AbiGii toxin family protein [Kofleriaceae bacterium]